jgi:hypothetical protein
LKENKKRFQTKIKVLGANRNLLAFQKTIILQSTHKIRSPQFWNCFFSIRNGGFSDELHEFRKVLNPEMTDAYFYQKHLCSPFGFGKCLRSVKGQVVVWETKPMEALIYTGRISNTIHKISRMIPSY